MTDLIAQIPDHTIGASNMPRQWWIWYRWENVQTSDDKEPQYKCLGVRDIAEAPEAVKQIDAWLYGKRGDE